MKFLYDPIIGLNHLPPPEGVRFSQGFGSRPEVYAQFGWKGHNGHDYAAPYRTPVYAMCDGWIVESTAKDTGYGLRLTQWIEVGGRQFDLIYGHFDEVLYPDIAWNISNRKYPVRTGQLLGYVDSTGFSSGHHLHITLREWQNGSVINQNNGYGGAVDPSEYLFNQDPPMIEFVQITDTEFGLKFTTDFVVTIVRFNNQNDAKEKLKNIPGTLNPDGSVDFSKARRINI